MKSRSSSLPIVSVPVTQIGVAPAAIGDPATRAAVDAKLDAVLKGAIKDAIGAKGARVEKFVDGLPLHYGRLLDQTVRAVVEKHVIPAMREDRGLAKLAGRLRKRRGRDGGPRIAQLLQLDTPLATHPLFVGDVRRSKVAEVLRIAELDVGLVERLDAGERPFEAWIDLDWEAAVAKKVLTGAQRDDLRFTADLSRLTGEQYGLVDAARKAKVRSARDLVAMQSTDWLELIRANPKSVPADMTPEAYAAALDKTVQQTFPSEYFAARVADRTVADRIQRSWRAIAPLVARNPEVLERLDPADVDWTGVDERERAALEASLREVTGLVGTYRRLALAGALREGDSAEVERRVAALRRFADNHRERDLRYLNVLDPATALDWTGIDDGDRPRVRDQVLAYQRVLHLAPEHDTATAMLRAGLDSSVEIADLSYRVFTARTGLDDEAAAPVYRKAARMSAKIGHGVQLMKDAISEIEQGKYFQGIDPKFVNDLKDLAGYEDLFGNTSYCDCEHCRSIFSPAAYFTDLMYFIDTKITKVAFAGLPSHPIRLRTRRPDLWHLKLTCENTDTLIPHLELVIEILEAYLERTLSIADVPQALAADRRAIGLPYHVPLATVREYVRAFKLELALVYELLEAPIPVVLAETLGLADGEWAALVDPTPLDVAWLTFPTADHTRMDAVDFLRFTALTRDGLDELAGTATAGDFTIVRVKTSNDIQSEKEVVTGLTSAKIDRIGRFLRLARSSGFTLAALDALMISPRIAGPQPFSPGSLAGIARFKRLRKLLGLSVESLIAVLDHIPVRALVPDGESLAERLGVTELGTFPVPFHHA
ncbi:MAG TPA: Tc toxin subunit A, partial [Polyangiaceae bacterium]|nr:Tc toxin subunit A [Polyangiaceae bacterium]